MSKKINKKPEAVAPVAIVEETTSTIVEETPVAETTQADPNQATCKTCGRTADRKEFIIPSSGQPICMEHAKCVAYLRANPKPQKSIIVNLAAAAVARAKTKPKTAKTSTEPKGPTCRDKVREFIKDRTRFSVSEIAELLSTNMNNASTTVNLLITRPGAIHMPIPFKMDKNLGKGIYVTTAPAAVEPAVVNA